MTLLRDVITIPEQVQAGDYVLKLTEGVERLDETLGEYVVTPALARAFDAALGLVEVGVTSGRSQASFLHGSFGSGKSHFMAVLHAVLGGDPRARGLAGLGDAVARHDGALQDRRFLRLTYHLIGARSLEQAVLGSFVEQVRRLHPDAALPAVHRTDALFADAERLRGQIGDEDFLAGLNGGSGAGGGVWGTFAGRWTPESYERALTAPPEDPDRGRLADAIVRTYYRSFTEVAEYVDLDTGLRVMAEYAKGLGYDAVVLFLDELVLWLASRLANRDFVANEGAKVAKLVESADARRPIPLVSFIARQRDLRDFFGESGLGAQQVAISDTFRWWEDRFDKIVLGDENLPYIAERRLLRPRDDAARKVLDEAFARIDRRPEIWNTLLDGVNTSDAHRGADQAAFRRTYPFSPALVSTVRAVSGAMQRERTALKVMQQVLVEQRSELTVDDVVPVGDVFDYVVEGQTALTPEMERHFAAARRLYHEKLRPMLLREHRLDEDSARGAGYRHPFCADDRIAKTLLLSALVPGVPALRDLDARRLAALNHGTIASPLPGEEATTVLAKVRAWQPQVPEIQLGGDLLNPTITVRLADVDYQGVLDRVRHVDNLGARRRLLRELVWRSLGIRHEESLFGVQEHPLVWRASKRTVEVVFGNVRDTAEIPDDLLSHGGERWRVVIDYPFDEEGRSPVNDLARIDTLKAAGATSLTVVWIPRFLTQQRLDDLGRLVLLDYLLGGSGERFDANADHLSATDRVQARAILENLQASIRERLLGLLQQAYGAAAPVPGDIDLAGGQDRVLVSLDPSFPPQEPVGATLEAAFRNLADQMLKHIYPAHPDFQPDSPELRPAELRKVLGYVESARQQPNGRVPVESADRALLRRICAPLGLGELYESVYVLDPASSFPWRNRFAQQLGRDGADGPVGVGRLRTWTDADAKRGLDKLVANLVIAAWAAVTDRVWYRYGAPVVPAPQLEQITDELELREQALPNADVWDRAVRRAGALLGVPGNPFRTAANVAELARRVREEARRLSFPARELVHLLEAHAGLLGLSPADPSGRLATARAAARLVHDLEQAVDGTALVTVLDAARLPANEQVVARSLRKAGGVAAALSGARWELLDALAGLEDDRREAGKAVLAALADAGRLDEFQTGLAAALDAAESDAVRLLTVTPRASAFSRCVRFIGS
jgi:hypothetical protein